MIIHGIIFTFKYVILIKMYVVRDILVGPGFKSNLPPPPRVSALSQIQ